MQGVREVSRGPFAKLHQTPSWPVNANGLILGMGDHEGGIGDHDGTKWAITKALNTKRERHAVEGGSPSALPPSMHDDENGWC